jgi:hypothetical protein
MLSSRARWSLRFGVLLALVLVTEIGLRMAGHLYLRRLAANDPSPSHVTVVCLGEASTEGLGVEPSDSYPAQLQALLRERFGGEVTVVVPPYAGQSTSQIADRVAEALDRYRPSLVIVMAGIDNEWVLQDSHLGRFLKGGLGATWQMRTQLALDRLRLFRLGRFLYDWVAVGNRRRVRAQGLAALGLATWTRPPPAEEVYPFAFANQEALNELWRDDVERILHSVEERGARALLMTYHIPGWVPVEEYVELAAKTRTPLVRNDLSYRQLAADGTLGQYLLRGRWYPNARGYSVIARNAFEKITELQLLPPEGQRR